MRYPLLSFIELNRLASLLDPVLKGAKIERIFIPECSEHPRGFFKNEWILESRKFQILLSLRSQACGLCVFPVKTFRSSPLATRSGFDLSLSKSLEGQTLRSVRCVEGERILMLQFEGESRQELHLHLIPASPKGLLNPSERPQPRDLEKIDRARIPDRPELTQSVETYSELWKQARIFEALTLRKNRLQSLLEQQLKSIQKKSASHDQQLEQSLNEPDWNRFGKLLQIHLHENPETRNGKYRLMDYETGKEVEVPADPKRNPKQQLEKFFHQAKRNKKRIEEAESRKNSLKEKQSLIEKTLQELTRQDPLELSRLLKLETESGFSISSGSETASRKISGFAGKIFHSKEGLTILSGRNQIENLELTFKIARGNDLWLHVRGRPGSHTLILLPPKKTASLETLLDAAHLCILHSGGKEWGKTEVDYTPRKNVKKIKNQSEVSYSGNKTLVVTLDPERIKRLYGEES